MKLTATDIKLRLNEELYKVGKTLHDAELCLATGELTKEAGIMDSFNTALKSFVDPLSTATSTTSGVTGAVSGVNELGKNVVNLAGLTALGSGLGAAGGTYLVYKGNQDSNDEIEKKEKERLAYVRALQSLQAAASNLK